MLEPMQETPAGGGYANGSANGGSPGGKVPPMAELAVESCRVTQTTIYSYHSTQTTIYRYQSTQTTASICPTWLTVHNCPKAGMTASLAFPGGLGPGHHVVQPRRSGAKFSTAKQDFRPFPGGFGSWASRCPAPPERSKIFDREARFSAFPGWFWVLGITLSSPAGAGEGASASASPDGGRFRQWPPIGLSGEGWRAIRALFPA